MQNDELVSVVCRERFESADVGVSRRRGWIVASLAQRSGGRSRFVLELHTERFEPMNRIERVVGQVVYEFGRALFVSSFIGDFVELLDRVFDSLLLLTFRIDCVERAFGDVRRSARDAAFLDNHNVGSGLHGRDGGCEARTAAADNAYVGIVGRFYGVVRAGSLCEGFRCVCLLGAILHTLLEAHAR